MNSNVRTASRFWNIAFAALLVAAFIGAGPHNHPLGDSTGAHAAAAARSSCVACVRESSPLIFTDVPAISSVESRFEPVVVGIFAVHALVSASPLSRAPPHA